jgi:hypothetical protein
MSTILDATVMISGPKIPASRRAAPEQLQDRREVLSAAAKALEQSI